jgi:hypothetical protein
MAYSLKISAQLRLGLELDQRERLAVLGGKFLIVHKARHRCAQLVHAGTDRLYGRRVCIWPHSRSKYHNHHPSLPRTHRDRPLG